MENWKRLVPFFSSDTYERIEKFLQIEQNQGKSILPTHDNIFNAFILTPFEKVKVVLLGQDPYPSPQHAHGLAFSIPKTTQDIPPTLKNIFKELKSDIGNDAPHGNLEHWAQQGVLLLNTALTVEEGKSNSHQSIGWKILTKEVLTLVSQKKKHCVFILWGNNARKYRKILTNPEHLIIESPHPSPLAAYRGFFGSKPFSKTNTYLKENGLIPIDWKIL
ncbi:uracil-DNA glycosylase [Candidatus Harpocratesius sp.]